MAAVNDQATNKEIKRTAPPQPAETDQAETE